MAPSASHRPLLPRPGSPGVHAKAEITPLRLPSRDLFRFRPGLRSIRLLSGRYGFRWNPLAELPEGNDAKTPNNGTVRAGREGCIRNKKTA
jgi:hypothetical protein